MPGALKEYKSFEFLRRDLRVSPPAGAGGRGGGSVHGGSDGGSLHGGSIHGGGYSSGSSSSGSVHGPSTPPAGGGGGGGSATLGEAYPHRPPPRMSSSFAGSQLASPNRPGIGRPPPSGD